jgi:hypothetical protein
MQRIHFNLFFISLFSLAICACKKETAKMGPGTSGLTVVNGVAGNNYLLTNFGDQLFVPFYSRLTAVYYATGLYSTSYSGRQNLALYQAADTSLGKPLYNLTLDLPINTIHTLFLMGTPGAPDQLLTTDQLPNHAPADSTMAIRFINMSQGSAPISVNLIGQVNGSEVSNLSYKSISAFKKYSAGSKISSYTFEFRDQATGQLLGSRVLTEINNIGSPENGRNLWRDQNITLALLGAPSPLTAPDRVLVIDKNYSFYIF